MSAGVMSMATMTVTMLQTLALCIGMNSFHLRAYALYDFCSPKRQMDNPMNPPSRTSAIMAVTIANFVMAVRY